MIIKIVITLLVVGLLGFGATWFATPIFNDECIPLEKPCSTWSQCCPTMRPGGTGLRLTPGTCFIFGDSKCKPVDQILHYSEFLDLRSQLNKTNFEELKQKYWVAVEDIR